MQILEILAYSIIQGITEFIPVSSSAHLYVLEIFFDWKLESMVYALAAHLGTLLAVLLAEKKTLFLIINKFFIKKEIDKYFISLLFCVFPVILTGFLIIVFFKEYYIFSITTIALTSIIGAILLELADKKKFYNRTIDNLSIKNAIFIGLFQVLSLLPGMSRSGTIITASRFLGFSRSFSIELALLTSIPVISLASCYGLYNTMTYSKEINLYFLYITLITFIFAFFSIKFLVKWAKHFSFRVFVIYRIIFGIVLIFAINLI
ncbi:undecaprenyl-diphosphate phosphatase [Alphaproteobacteria bacterium]|nr:undecaprenyl-diphosphate phosphatase [Alphaproteobacteria bacterium]